MIRAARGVLLAALGLGACGADRAAVPAPWSKVPGNAVMAFVAPVGHLPRELDVLCEDLVRSAGLRSGSEGDIGWLIDPRAPTGYASLADSPTFRRAFALRPPPSLAADSAWLFVDLQVQVDGIRARLVDRGRFMEPLLDALGLSNLLFAVGEVKVGGKGGATAGLDVDLEVESVDSGVGPCALIAADAAAPSPLGDPAEADRAWLELRFDPAVAARMVSAAMPQLREGEVRLDAALFGYLAGAGVALMKQADGRLALRIGSDTGLEFALGVRDQEEARDILARRIPQLDRDDFKLPTGETVRFEPGRIVVARGETVPAGGFRPTEPCVGRVAVGAQRIGFGIVHEGPTILRVRIRSD